VERNDVIEDLNKLLRDEVAATETYRQALDKIRKDYGHDSRFQDLTRMLQDHEQAAAQLRAHIRQLGGVESQGSGAWGTWSNTVMGAARLLGDKAALKALKEGEESGLKDYHAVIDRAPAEMTDSMTSIVAREQEHVRQLDRMIEAA
jgi:bacterioferritin (cytochrome b1)